MPTIIRKIKSDDSLQSAIENDLRLSDSIVTIASAVSDYSLQSYTMHSLSKTSLRSQSFDLSDTEDCSQVLRWELENNENKIVM